ncbi:MAG TPA: methylenetetrahydrofolate reductase [NAD(P)H] [Alphaproteobacteria bacterium]|nr:methylenetetrahydrofolate reductase [NAD(P)H] [Alphaproteobacteria bacterium]USO05079.1 MAG: methylenetetrahydrofolate reductase [NAD(P)H] [Rhodospirillales bacterium]HOO82345.1 methylenetetrahydrofolate reductase [NAD(P)H] [Alphaproteobacteria bacterium]
MSAPTISFEFFPPKTEKASEALWEAVADLAALGPKFMTVTYGAGGSTRDGTVDTIAKMKEDTGLPIGSHLTFINTPKDQLHEFTSALWAAGIRHIVALRGDMPDDLQWPLDEDGEYFQYTSDFVEGLKGWHDFEISVGCYPEKHPDALDMSADIAALKLKCEAGADRAITQFFFDNDVYYNFRDECAAAGIETPIVPGLLPIHDFKSMCNFAKKCQASVPAGLHEKFAGLEDKPEEAQKVAADLLILQAQNLAQNGVEHLHFYTLNKSMITQEVVQCLNN